VVFSPEEVDKNAIMEPRESRIRGQQWGLYHICRRFSGAFVRRWCIRELIEEVSGFGLGFGEEVLG
jgi:hypothetical protein